MTPAQLADLRRQHVTQARAGYDGHNRKPVAATIHELASRRRRRRWNWILRGWMER